MVINIMKTILFINMIQVPITVNSLIKPLLRVFFKIKFNYNVIKTYRIEKIHFINYILSPKHNPTIIYDVEHNMYLPYIKKKYICLYTYIFTSYRQQLKRKKVNSIFRQYLNDFEKYLFVILFRQYFKYYFQMC